jgi:hypothetical protein
MGRGKGLCMPVRASNGDTAHLPALVCMRLRDPMITKIKRASYAAKELQNKRFRFRGTHRPGSSWSPYRESNPNCGAKAMKMGKGILPSPARSTVLHSYTRCLSYSSLSVQHGQPFQGFRAARWHSNTTAAPLCYQCDLCGRDHPPCVAVL